MLFDLAGKRRRVVQATYLTLAMLMGGGLVFFGIGGEVSGGLFDAFSDRQGVTGGDGNQLVEERIERNEQRLQDNPQSAESARKELVRDYYQLAVSQTQDNAIGFPPEARDELRQASANWRAYLELDPERPDTSLARLALEMYRPEALGRPQEAKEAAQLIARVEDDANAYLALVQFASQARDTRLADLAGQKAVDLAPKSQRKAVERQVESLKAPPMPTTPPPGGPPPQP